jgi:phosphatidylinositol 4-kinase
LPAAFLKEVQSFVKFLFTSGQAILQSHDHEANGRDDTNGSTHVINKFKLNVLTNAVCVDILVWAARDEQGGKNRIGKRKGQRFDSINIFTKKWQVRLKMQQFMY